MLKFKVLNEESDLLEFINLYESAFKSKETTGYKLSLAQLKSRDKVVGVHKKGQLVGGYTLSNTPNTLIDNITDKNLARMEEHYPLDSCYDLGTIWKKGISTLQFTSVVWPRIILDTIFFNLGRSNIVGYVITGHGRADAYDKASPFYAQSSPVKHDLNILVFTRKNLIKAFISGFTKELARFTIAIFKRPKPSQLSEAKQ